MISVPAKRCHCRESTRGPAGFESVRRPVGTSWGWRCARREFVDFFLFGVQRVFCLQPPPSKRRLLENVLEQKRRACDKRRLSRAALKRLPSRRVRGIEIYQKRLSVRNRTLIGPRENATEPWRSVEKTRGRGEDSMCDRRLP